MKITDICIYNMYPSITGIRNSHRSVSDSIQCHCETYDDDYIVSYNHCLIGKKDEELIKKLLKSPSERKFLRQILVSMNIITSIKHWAQIDTFKIGTVRNSESTMHSITKGNVSQDDFEREINKSQIFYINDLIHDHNNETDSNRKKYYFELIDANLPGGYILKSHWTANYEVLRNIYATRKNHKMFYWKEFCDYIRKLPYFSLLIEGNENE